MSSGSEQSFFAYTGCYTTVERDARGDGISAFHVTDGGRAWAPIQSLPVGDNPSFLTTDRSGRYVCAVHGDRSHISAYAIDAGQGTLTPVSSNGTRGTNPVHLAFDASNRFIVLANHWTSTVALLAFDAQTGAIGDVMDLAVLAGEPGPHRIEQQMAKPHQTVFEPSGRYLFVPDKGIDRIFSFTIDGGRLRPTAQRSVVAREGAGPRHIAFHPTAPFGYVANELDCTVVAYHLDRADGALTPFQCLSSLPDSYTGNGRAAEIEVTPDGLFLIVSTRGADLLTTYRIDQETGRLEAAGSIACGGKTPRFFTFLPQEDCLFVAHESSDTIKRFELDRSSGGLVETHLSARVLSPSALCFVPRRDGVMA